jgi:23S rRNA (cytosine1962-C5)-methyltransferase
MLGTPTMPAALDMPLGRVTLTGRGRRRFQRGHPWVFADDLSGEQAQDGGLVAIEDPSGAHLGWGTYSGVSKLRVRAFSRAAEPPDRTFFAHRVARAIELRERAGLLAPHGACRLLAGDSERVPGLVVDRYAQVLVLQSGTRAADRLAPLVLELLLEQLPWRASAALVRSDAGVRRLEGLESVVAPCFGQLPDEIVVEEDGLFYEVDVRAGHKTGHYLDQRENRRRAAELARGRDVLDAFCYDGLLGLRAAREGARSVLCLDQSTAALERLQRNVARNGLGSLVRAERVDAMSDLRARAQAGQRFGLVALDPPAFARNRRELEGALRGYKELNLRALALLEPGGHLMSSSCSHALGTPAFLDLLAASAADAGRACYLEGLFGAACDHPVLLELPESAYLKCALLRAE